MEVPQIPHWLAVIMFYGGLFGFAFTLGRMYEAKK